MSVVSVKVRFGCVSVVHHPPGLGAPSRERRSAARCLAFSPGWQGSTNAGAVHAWQDDDVDYDVGRFVRAQAPVYDDVLGELQHGRKSSHWMWFVFPQVAGLGRSETARFYAIGSLDEARAYLAHPLLGPRLLECVRLLLEIEGRTADVILGPIDALKLRSSMTLFLRAAPDEPVFAAVIDRFYGGVADEATDAILR
jgi:uncharacterized protein (DUF1810 family)